VERIARTVLPGTRLKEILEGRIFDTRRKAQAGKYRSHGQRATLADMSATLHLTLLAVSWMLYATVHSLLASTPAKRVLQRRYPRHYRTYRLVYNLLAVILLVPPLWLLAAYAGGPLWHWPPPLDRLADLAALLAVAGFAWSLRYYDTGEFLGTRQLGSTTPTLADEVPLTLSPLHRWVRHPWYFLGLVIVWTREMNAALLVTAVMLSLYLVIGSRLEDAKLIATYGDAYRRYRDSIPGLLPLPWRHLSKEEAEGIQRQSAEESSSRPDSRSA
jgi:protein-S-isoprenylcysteine O-methyltransferase Ste14